MIKTPTNRSGKQLTIQTLRKRADFVRLSSHGFKAPHPNLVLQMLPQAEKLGCVRVGFTATKRLGNAVVRNRTKRRLRAAVQQLFPAQAVADSDYVLIGRPTTASCEFNLLLRDLEHAMARVHRKVPRP